MGFCVLGLGFMTKQTIEKWEWDFNLSNTGWDLKKNNSLGIDIGTPPSRPSYSSPITILLKFLDLNISIGSDFNVEARA